MEKLKAPFVYFGGKSKVADVVWQRFGDVPNYVEPFCGSAAVLLARPHRPRLETINDADCMVANFWRATSRDPEAVAHHVDWPVNEADLLARHRWLVTSEEVMAFRERMKTDPDYYDAKIAGWWCWGINIWIGHGWCNKHRKRQRPFLGNSNGTTRLNRSDVDIKRAMLGWLADLQDRMRTVSVCCGDWCRVVGPAVTTKYDITAVFLDPPYSNEAGRHMTLYAVESGTVAHDVRAWCLANGNDPLFRIALCGYEGEGHEELEAAGWVVLAWDTGAGGYGSKGGRGRANAKRERIWFSPHCLHEPTLF